MRVSDSGTALRVLSLAVAMSAATPLTAFAQEAALLVSTSMDRADSLPLDGATLTGDVFIHWPGTDREGRRVQFYLDAETNPKPIQVEAWAPFDFNGTGRGRGVPPARGFDTTGLTDGEHTVHAVVREGSAASRLYVARFQVANGRLAPTDPVATVVDPGPEPVAEPVVEAELEPVAEPVTTVVEPLAMSDADSPPTEGVSVVVEPLVTEPEPPVGAASPPAEPEPPADPATPSDVVDPVVPSAPAPVEEPVEEEPVDTPAPAVEDVAAGPGARFTVECEGLACTFDASASVADAPIDDWAWDFGDGATGESSPVVTHVYDSEGARLASLTVWEQGEDCAVMEVSGEVEVSSAEL